MDYITGEGSLRQHAWCVRRAVGLADYRLALSRISSVAIVTQPVHRLRLLPLPQVTSGSVQYCGHVAADRQTDTDRHTDARDHSTFCVVYDSREM